MKWIIIFLILVFIIRLLKSSLAEHKKTMNMHGWDLANFSFKEIPTIEMPQIYDYKPILKEIETFFNGFAKKSKVGNSVNIHNLHDQTPKGVYYGYTRYTGETNRTGKREVALDLPDGQVFTCLNRDLWNKYEKEIGDDKKPWVGCSDGESTYLYVFKKSVSKDLTEQRLRNFYEDDSAEKFYQLLMKEVKRLDLIEYLGNDEEDSEDDDEEDWRPPYVDRYYIAGISRYTSYPFVAFGWAKKEPDNPYNPKAVILKTIDGTKVGYIPDKALNTYYDRNGGFPVPVVLAGYYGSSDKILGYVYTFTNSEKEYPALVEQYAYAYKKLYRVDEHTIKINYAY